MIHRINSWSRIQGFAFLFLLSSTCFGIFRESDATDLKNLPYESWYKVLDKKWIPEIEKFPDRDPGKIHALVVHSTDARNWDNYLQLTLENGYMIHGLVTKNGEILFEPKWTKKLFPGAPGMDISSLHIAYEGNSNSLQSNKAQKEKLSLLILWLTKSYKIPLSNYDIASKKGVFSHNQAKRKFGGFADFSPCGGEKTIEFLLKENEGKYFEEENWKGRFDSGWVLRKENIAKIQTTFKPELGRGITPAPKSPLSIVEKQPNGKIIEEFRVQYMPKGKIKPSCVVLHFTAIPSFQDSLKILELRNLTATVMVDKDGKVYQLLDSLEDKAAAAYGTNDNCIQVEIVGKDTQELMKNRPQIDGVKKLVLELSQLYNFNLQNEDITSFSGVYSHTQAKKKWGGSIFLNAKDFDPGEEYMELIIKELGGIYFPEAEWKNRNSWEWAILNKEFQP